MEFLPLLSHGVGKHNAGERTIVTRMRRDMHIEWSLKILCSKTLEGLLMLEYIYTRGANEGTIK